MATEASPAVDHPAAPTPPSSGDSAGQLRVPACPDEPERSQPLSLFCTGPPGHEQMQDIPSSTLLFIDEVPGRLVHLFKALDEAGYKLLVGNLSDFPPHDHTSDGSRQSVAIEMVLESFPGWHEAMAADSMGSFFSGKRRHERFEEGLFMVSHEGDVLLGTQCAWNLIKRFFKTTSGSVLPPIIQGWLQEDQPCSLRIQNGGTTLTLRRFAGSGTSEPFMVRLEESASGVCPASLEELGLTPKEAEVLFWFAQGKTSPEIALIVDSALNTVKKHAQNIYQKLGVENRTSAALRAMEILQP